MGVTVVISGSGRGAGKTAVGCALIRALPEWEWTAVKITPETHGGQEASGTGADAEGKPLPRAPLVSIENESSSQKGTGRYLAAGARRAVLVSVDDAWDGELFPELQMVLNEGLTSGNLLVESNRFLGEAAIFLVVTGVTEAEWKPTLHRCADRAEALVLTHGMTAGSLPERLRDRRLFSAREGEWAPAELVEFVRGRLRGIGQRGCGGG